MAVLRGLGLIGPRARAALPALKEMLKDEDQFYRMRAAYAVARIDPGNEIAFPLLVTSLEDRRHGSSAAMMLKQMGPEAKAAVPALIGALDAIDNFHIAEALGNIGPDAKAALPVLRDLLTLSSQRVREAAAVAIYKIEKP